MDSQILADRKIFVKLLFEKISERVVLFSAISGLLRFKIQPWVLILLCTVCFTDVEFF